jgi:hypothetical protein
MKYLLLAELKINKGTLSSRESSEFYIEIWHLKGTHHTGKVIKKTICALNHLVKK